MNKILTCFILLILITIAPLKSQIAIIANKSVPKQSLYSERILDIYSLNVQFWNNGTKIKVFDLKASNPIKERFFSKLGSSAVDIKKIWLKKQFSGKAMPPEALESEDEMLKRVAETPGAIGFINMSKVTKEVQVLATLE